MLHHVIQNCLYVKIQNHKNSFQDSANRSSTSFKEIPNTVKNRDGSSSRLWIYYSSELI